VGAELERARREVLGQRHVRLDRALRADVPDRARIGAVGIGIPARPQDGQPLDEVGLGHGAVPPRLLDLLHAGDLRVAQTAVQVRVLLGEDVAERPERRDADEPEEPIGVRQREVERQVPPQEWPSAHARSTAK
jgi:hypothetical protein